jgi:hypothetical protein
MHHQIIKITHFYSLMTKDKLDQSMKLTQIIQTINKEIEARHQILKALAVKD